LIDSSIVPGLVIDSSVHHVDFSGCAGGEYRLNENLQPASEGFLKYRSLQDTYLRAALAAVMVAVSGPVASAADLDAAIGLIVAGEVEKASGVQIFDIPNAGPLTGRQ
jgi:hypothetical protein